MFTVKAIAGRNADVFGYEATSYKVSETYDSSSENPADHGCRFIAVEFWTASQTSSITLYARHFERIVIENASGRTVENIVEPRPSPSE